MESQWGSFAAAETVEYAAVELAMMLGNARVDL